MMFAAVPLEEVQKQILEEMPEAMDDWGYIHGWYVDGYIVGAIEESTEEYIAPEFWCPIEKDTLEIDLEAISKIARGEVEGTEHIDNLLALDELIPRVLYLDRYKEYE